MKAADLMTRSVLTVAPDTPVERVARLLVEHGISAIPVADDGIPVGIISESDLVAGSAVKGAPRRSWLACMLSSGGRPDPGALAHCFEPGKLARDVMTAPVITVNESASVADIVELMTAHGVKRLPVVRGGRLSGILSRVDLLRAVAGGMGTAPDRLASGHHAPGHNPLIDLDRSFRQGAEAAAGPAAADPVPARRAAVSAADFRRSVADFKEREAAARARDRSRAREAHAHDIEALLDTHVSEDFWRHMLLDARHAAERGAGEVQMVRFPRETCSDMGRMINQGEAGWPTTLRGQAAEVWHRWSRELEPQGFRIVARTLEYPGGFPGDIGLFLVWGEAR